MENLDAYTERRTTDVVLFAIVFFSLLLSATGVILDSRALAFIAGGVAFVCVLPFLVRD